MVGRCEECGSYTAEGKPCTQCGAESRAESHWDHTRATMLAKGQDELVERIERLRERVRAGKPLVEGTS